MTRTFPKSVVVQMDPINPMNTRVLDAETLEVVDLPISRLTVDIDVNQKMPTSIVLEICSTSVKIEGAAAWSMDEDTLRVLAEFNDFAILPLNPEWTPEDWARATFSRGTSLEEVKRLAQIAGGRTAPRDSGVGDAPEAVLPLDTGRIEGFTSKFSRGAVLEAIDSRIRVCRDKRYDESDMLGREFELQALREELFGGKLP